MAKLTTLQPRIKQVETRRLKPLNSEASRVSGRTRYNLKRRIYARDSGRCCGCQRVVDLRDSELDHRLALQFGGSNDPDNLWTLCTECHAAKSAREAATGQPDDAAMKYQVPKEKEKRFHHG